MTFDDIDTPATTEELGGIADDAVIEDQAQEVADEPVDDAPEAETPAAKAEPEREQVIPRARFDEVNAKYRANLEEVERLRSELNASKTVQSPVVQTATDTDVSAELAELARQEYDAMIEGDRDKAVELKLKREEIRESRSKQAAFAMMQQERDATEQANAQKTILSEVNATVAQALEAFPFLDSNSPDANPEAIAEVVEWRDFYIAKGEAPAAALAKATNKIAPQYANAAPVAPVTKPDTRKQAALARNANESKQQAPSQVAGVGNRTNPPLMKVETQAQWEKLSKDDRATLLN
ncbi:hypothetical protein [Propionivibrio sp.]|uniref:hypothetical protein n=1 Tax=Propionivibrio sp. TaxID=2212460 RepID=UPI003BF0FDFC